ncbi:hypothetical protein C8A01DRAFT_36676 [Parachaetomium inaequale]|uniref:GATA-type domain-containing protein n=1 Tax=Parachaetomium inaequale TaxID=2588326 RepID=A0AAN6SQI3_9PEZI|nr:hypothetical protein C8A01DRAFT_36676 [Parachaetomium inaequale]
MIFIPWCCGEGYPRWWWWWLWGTSVWAVRDGPFGPRSLCNNCGFIFECDRKLPRWTKLLHAADARPF